LDRAAEPALDLDSDPNPFFGGIQDVKKFLPPHSHRSFEIKCYLKGTDYFFSILLSAD
jgi:hypothetical protein